MIQLLMLIILLLLLLYLEGKYKKNYRNIKYSRQNHKEWYRNVYLKSSHWRKRRNRALARSCFMCEDCSSTKQLNVHHLSYDNLWSEPDYDLRVLCRACHKRCHNIKS